MSLTLIPLLLIVLLMISADGSARGRVELLLSGRQEVARAARAVIVGDADAIVPAGEDPAGPIYQIGGQLKLRGVVRGDVIQLAGRLVVGPDAAIQGELLQIGGETVVAPPASIGRRSTLDLAPTATGGAAGVVSLAILAGVLALIGAGLGRRRPQVLDTVADALVGHPIVTTTVGLLVSLTAIAVFVFMAFTFVLIPLSIVGIIVGLATLGFAIIVWGRLLTRGRAPRRAGLMTALGVVAVIALLQLLSMVPVVGDLLVAAAALAGIGASLLTYFGLQRFEPSTPPA